MKVFKRSVWTLFTSFFAIFFVALLVGESFLHEYETQINYALHIVPYEKVSESGSDAQYFKTPFLKEDGKTYDDLAMRQHSMDVSRQADGEGAVLLWNHEVDGEPALPLKKNAKISFFGVQSAARNYLYTGNGSGRVNVTTSDFPDLKATFESEGYYTCNPNLYHFYKNKGGSTMVQPALGPDGKKDNHYKEFQVNQPALSQVKAISGVDIYNDAAIFVISRNGSEDGDTWFSTEECLDENYLDLSYEEKETLDYLQELKNQQVIKRLILLLNTGTPMAMKHILEYSSIDACLWVGMGGNASFYAIYDLISGKVSPSGRLVDTYVYDTDSSPSAVNTGAFQFSKYGDLPAENRTSNAYNHAYIVYQEGIYVGYRYYETRYEDVVMNAGNASSPVGVYHGTGNWNYQDEVVFPFGYGKSYTTFAYSNYEISKKEEDYIVSLTVTNTGRVAGKDVVQIYLQKPYTEYDRENGIEKASVELVGYAKTNTLLPGKSETVQIEVKEEEFKTYDSYKEKTYILEKGDYYLAFGENAHQAVNSILAVKGYGKSNGMDEAGNAAFAKKITIKKDDFEKYSMTEDGVKITNQFDDVDLNLYEGTKDQKIQYLSRKAWDQTYPTSPVSLVATNEIMVKDMQYAQEIEADPQAQMPVYGKDTSPLGHLTLAMLMDKEYDDPLWEDLLNEMTWQETIELCGLGSHIIKGVPSISSPSAIAHDGPAGVKETPKAGKNGELDSCMAFPCGVVLASTFHDELVKEVGEAFGLEMLHTGVSEIYGTGAGIHRSFYGGRNWEYFSEDSFLSGKILYDEVVGLQSQGAIVNIKHMVLNDQEIYRCGGTTWANEQSIREIYLKAFEMSVKEGHANGVMSSLNRLGCTWAGKHKGLLTNVLRKEWGFIGIVETDSATGTYMRLGEVRAEAVIAGGDLWLRGSNNEAELWGKYKDNPTVAQALRQSAKNILYTIAHSSAMNGTDSSTKMIKVTPWYFTAVKAMQGVIGGLLGISLILMVLSYVFVAKGLVKVEEGPGEETPYPMEGEKVPLLTKKKKRQLLIYGIVVILSFGAIFTTVKVVGSLKHSTPDDPGFVIPPSTGEEPSIPETILCDHLCPNCHKCNNWVSREEACLEKCTCYGKPTQFSVIDPNFQAEGKNSNRGINSEDVAIGCTWGQETWIDVSFTSDKERTISLGVVVSRDSKELKFTDVYQTTLNGNLLHLDGTMKAYGSRDWLKFDLVIVGNISLVQGENHIHFSFLPTKGEGDVQNVAYNFNSFILFGEGEYHWM